MDRKPALYVQWWMFFILCCLSFSSETDKLLACSRHKIVTRTLAFLNAGKPNRYGFFWSWEPATPTIHAFADIYLPKKPGNACTYPDSFARRCSYDKGTLWGLCCRVGVGEISSQKVDPFTGQGKRFARVANMKYAISICENKLHGEMPMSMQH